MGKRHPVNTFQSFSRKIALGHGRGEGVNYTPWISGHEFASSGKYIRLWGKTVPRQYCFMSELEADAFLIYDSMPDVSDILEQYYCALEETLLIADLLNYKHPYSGKYYNAITTDLLIHKGNAWIARAVKTSKDLSDKRVMEKLAIEHEYFFRRNIDWKIITEKQLNRDLVQNLRFLREGASPEDILSDQQELQKVKTEFCRQYADESVSFPLLLHQIESRFCLPPGTALSIFKALIREGKIQIDMNQPLNMLFPRHPIERSTPDERYRSYH